MLNTVVTTSSSCYAPRPFPASNPAFLFPCGATANNPNNPNPNSSKGRHVNTFHKYLYFSTRCLRPPCAGSFICSSASGFCCSLSRTRGDQKQKQDKKAAMGFPNVTASEDSSAAHKIPRLNATVLGESLASEDDQLILPSDQFSFCAHVSSHQQVFFSSPI